MTTNFNGFIDFNEEMMEYARKLHSCMRSAPIHKCILANTGSGFYSMWDILFNDIFSSIFLNELKKSYPTFLEDYAKDNKMGKKKHKALIKNLLSNQDGMSTQRKFISKFIYFKVIEGEITLTENAALLYWSLYYYHYEDESRKFNPRGEQYFSKEQYEYANCDLQPMHDLDMKKRFLPTVYTLWTFMDIFSNQQLKDDFIKELLKIDSNILNDFIKDPNNDIVFTKETGFERMFSIYLFDKIFNKNFQLNKECQDIFNTVYYYRILKEPTPHVP